MKTWSVLVAAFIWYIGSAYFQPESLSTEGWVSLRVLVLMALLWMTEVIPLAATALIPLMIFPFTLTDGSNIFSSYSHPIIFLFLGGFILGAALQTSKAHEWIAYRISMIFKNSRYSLLGIILATSFLSMWISNTATALMFMPIALSLTRHQGRDVTVTVLFAVMVAASIGGYASLVGTPPNAVYAALIQESRGKSVGFMDWMRLGLPITIILIVALFLYLQHRLKTEIDISQQKVELSSAGKKVLVAFALTAGCWMFQKYLAPTHIIGVAAAIALLSMNKWDQGILGPKPFALVPLGILLLFGGGIALSKGIMTTDAGSWLADQIFRDIQSQKLLTVIGVSFSMLVSEIGSNTASANLLGPLAISVAETKHIAVEQILFPVVMGSNLGFMLPVATPPNAIAFATGQIRLREMIAIGFFIDLIGVITVTAMTFVYIELGWL